MPSLPAVSALAAPLPPSSFQPSSQGFTNSTHSISRGGAAICVSGQVEVSAGTSMNRVINYQLPQNQYEVTQTFVSYISPDNPFMNNSLGGNTPISGIYNIGATLCLPRDGKVSKGVQLLTHGVGFDRYYWDFVQNYSYVDTAVNNGYAVFFYDRLGVGVSEKADPLSVVQSSLEVEIAHSLGLLLRNGTIGGSVGHSFGSIITQALTMEYPTLLDAAILTGFSVSSAGLAAFFAGLNWDHANQNAARFAGLNNGHIVSDTEISNQIGFYHYPGFDPAILAKAETTKASATFGEIFTTGAAGGNATAYTNPVAVVNGLEDLPFCYGNCSYPVDLAAQVKSLYPAVSAGAFKTYLGQDAGHALNLHYAAADAFSWIMSFLSSNGL
ncbi:hypothetical protein LTR78_003024 [Recurvomyces mirabilis]|uniref:AB hydrolase-1 domain-containing protein n=1 Tax=Recurvomyces mirabilis TaxID=574656 RepID=A0AAE1C3I9_9PEZI|nr:hypothetical protein LTR78_003024 [Recurvomyces mirabilis]KAK5157155.1 hypothetical protein LTS14_004673 [Recurvomyces mirabilis]